MPANREKPTNTRRANDFATLNDVVRLVNAGLKAYEERNRPWYVKLWRWARRAG